MSLFINGRFVTQPLSGVQRFATETARALQARDPVYELLTPCGGSLSWPGALEVGQRQGQSWEQLELYRTVRGEMLINLGNTAPILCRQQIVVIHDAGVFSTPKSYSRKFRIWYKFMQAALAKRGACIVTVSEFSRREILHHLPANPSQVWIIPEGADHMQRILAESAILEEHELESDRYVLCVGAAASHKNLASLGLLARQLNERDIPLVITGSVGSTSFQTARLPQLARYIGRVSDAQLKALYQHAGCFVFPSRYEGFGLPPLEAMACGCPVVAADIPALREVCGDAAQFCDPYSPEDISARVLAVLESPSQRQEMNEAGKARAATFTWKFAVSVLDDIRKSAQLGA